MFDKNVFLTNANLPSMSEDDYEFEIFKMMNHNDMNDNSPNNDVSQNGKHEKYEQNSRASSLHLNFIALNDHSHEHSHFYFCLSIRRLTWKTVNRKYSELDTTKKKYKKILS